ncbi:tetratricopeptide repeat protein [Patescibacteria group bacterium]|nr:tetratricopeptide repeat protein [Patescibacteria group bacterium]MBU4580773.1 tetratricopeptide repeat protein [Patescibacteria group bacterium]
MNKKNIIYIVLVILIASFVASFYLTDFYKSNESDLDKIYTSEDFPNALKTTNEEILQLSLEDLNGQYQDLRDGKYIYLSWINIGILKKRLGDNPGTEEAWLNAIDYGPDRSLAYGNLADLYLFNLGEYEKAEEYYQKVLNMAPDNYTHYHGLASLYRYNMTEKSNLIEGIMLKGAENNPMGIENYYMYLANYFAEGPEDNGGNDKEKAKYYIEETLKINPDLKDQLPDL